MLFGCSAIDLKMKGFGPAPAGSFAEVCKADRLVNSPWSAEVANLYVGQKFSVLGMYKKDTDTLYFIDLQGPQDLAVFFAGRTGQLEPDIYMRSSVQKVLPTLKENKVVIKLNGCV